MSAPYETEADRQAMLLGLGESATYTPSGGAAKTIYVILEKQVESFNEVGHLIGYRPEAEASTADLTGTVLGGTLLVDGTTYSIEENLPDGTGMTILSLSEV